MRLLLAIVLLVTTLLPAWGAASRAKTAATAHGKKSNWRRVTVRRKVNGRWVTSSHLVRVNSRPALPQAPEPARLREIQMALAEKGYFKGEADGVWKADSVSALKQFQTEQNLTADGKINARSLIGLGLGPNHEASVSVPALAAPQ